MKILAFVVVVAALLAGAPAWGLEKGGMPDLAQIDQTCLPTSAANLMIWFGHHGYPNLILPGDSEEARENHTIHLLMADTGARYDLGTEMEAVTHGLETYIHRAGYGCRVEYRGLDGANQPFRPDWLQQNDDPNKGFVLLLTYCHYDPQHDSFTEAWNAGHAVTLVNAEPDTLLIHDPAHESDATGRKIITPHALTGGTFIGDGEQLPVEGLMMLTGSLLEAPPQAEVMLTGAVCITMRPAGAPSDVPATGPNAVLAGTPGSAAESQPASAAVDDGWWRWLVSLVLGK
jgi:hypothetical protein